MQYAVVLVIVAVVLVSLRILRRRGSAPRSGNLSIPGTRVHGVPAPDHRRSRGAREGLTTLYSPEHAVANSSVPRPLGIQFGLPSDGGVEVDSVAPGSPAARVGIRAGVVLTSIGGRPTPDAEAAGTALGAQFPGLGVRLTWTDHGTPHDTEVIL